MNLVEQVTMMAPDTLEPHPKNPRRGDVELIRESIRENGFVNPILVQQDRNRIIAGEHRWRAAKAEGLDEVPVILLDVDDDHALRLLLVDNKASDVGVYDEGVLADVLAAVAEANAELLGTGWSTVEYEAMLNSIDLNSVESERDSGNDDNVPGAEDSEDDDGERGTDLALLDVVMGEPEHLVARLDVYRLKDPKHGRSHTLVVCDVMRDHDVWTPLLADMVAVTETDVVFLPYPGVFLALTEKAGEHDFLMIQPNKYLAGHLLDKWCSVKGDETVTKDEPAES